MFNPLGWLRIPTAEAHCDIPCGIYDPISAKIAAQTVHKMVLRIQSLEPPAANAGGSFWVFLYRSVITIPYNSEGIKPGPCYNFGASGRPRYITVQIPTIFVKW